MGHCQQEMFGYDKEPIKPVIVGSIPECDTVTEYLDRIKSQFSGSSKTYATQLIKQLVTERYSGNSGIREHILFVITT